MRWGNSSIAKWELGDLYEKSMTRGEWGVWVWLLYIMVARNILDAQRPSGAFRITATIMVAVMRKVTAEAARAA